MTNRFSDIFAGTREHQSLQNFYDQACVAVIRQGKASINEGGGCLYRFENGNEVLKCPVGHMLTDAQIKKYRIQEGDFARGFPSALIEELLPEVREWVARGFLSRLQKAHDVAAGSQDFLTVFRRSARDLGLEYRLTVNF